LGKVQQRAVVVGHPCRKVGDRSSTDCGIRDDELLAHHDHLVSRSRVTHTQDLFDEQHCGPVPSECGGVPGNLEPPNGGGALELPGMECK
jgi:hypothetical protein